MDRFGDELRGERERRGLTIEAICSVTKVSSRHLQALESNRFQDLPGGVFRKGILRSYLSTLGLDEADWMARFEAALAETSGATTANSDWTEFAVNVKRGRVPSSNGIGLVRWIGVVAMLLLLGALTCAAWKYVVQPRLRHQTAAASLRGS